MAALSSGFKAEVAAAIQRWWSAHRELCDFKKTDLAAAVDATDAWIESNAASFNSALPLPFRTSATALQKTLLFCYVALRRAKRDGADHPMTGE